MKATVNKFYNDDKEPAIKASKEVNNLGELASFLKQMEVSRSIEDMTFDLEVYNEKVYILHQETSDGQNLQ